MQNNRRLIFIVTKVERENGEIGFIVSNNQEQPSFWLPELNKVVPGQWQKWKEKLLHSAVKVLANSKILTVHFEHVRITFNQEYFILVTPSSNEDDWVDFKMPVSTQEMRYFFEAMKDFRTIDF